MDRYQLIFYILISLSLVSFIFVNYTAKFSEVDNLQQVKLLRSFEKKSAEFEERINQLHLKQEQLNSENLRNLDEITEWRRKHAELNEKITEFEEEKQKLVKEKDAKIQDLTYKFNSAVDDVVSFAASKSQKMWDEFQCLGPEYEDPLVWEESIPKDQRCGCFLSPNFTTPKECPKRQKPGKDEPLWIVLIGDSTMRQFAIGFREILKNHDARCYTIQDSQVNRNIKSRDVEAILPVEQRAKKGFWGYWFDSELYCPGLIVSYRALSGVSASLGLSIIRNPHLHHVPPIYERFESVPMLDEPNFLEIPWSLPMDPPKNGPDVFLLAAGVWEAARSDYEPSDSCAFACLEYQRCKMKLKKPTTRNLFRRRMNALIEESKCLWGPDRLILRNSAENDLKDYMPHFNREIAAIAKEKQVRFLDYNSSNSEHDTKHKDMAHPPEWVVRRGLKTLIEMIPKDRLPPLMKPILDINKSDSGPPPDGKYQHYLQ